MASEKQKAANKANAQKCTGPATPKGRARSSQNALKTGLDAKSDVIRTENRDDYTTLIAEYYNRFQPLEPEERNLVDTLISSEWLRRRYFRVDAGIWEQHFVLVDNPTLGGTFLERRETLSRVERRIDSAMRNFNEALRLLRKIQADRPSDPFPAETGIEGEEAAALIFDEETAPQPPVSAQAQQADPDPDPETQNPATEERNPKLVSFFTRESRPSNSASEPAKRAAETDKTQAIDPTEEDNPPIAA